MTIEEYSFEKILSMREVMSDKKAFKLLKTVDNRYNAF